MDRARTRRDLRPLVVEPLEDGDEVDQEEVLEDRRRDLRPRERGVGGEDVDQAESRVEGPAAEGADEGQEEGGEGGARVGEEELLGEVEGGGPDGGVRGGDGVL